MEIVGIFLVVIGIPTLVALIREARERKKRVLELSQPSDPAKNG
jgi:hypothetical protein